MKRQTCGSTKCRGALQKSKNTAKRTVIKKIQEFNSTTLDQLIRTKWSNA